MKKLIYALIVSLIFSTFGSASAAFPDGLVAFYTFNDTPNDSSGVSEPISLVNAPFIDGQVLYLNGEYLEYRALAQISRFYYDQFTVSTDFHALVFDIEKDTIIIGGELYRWFGLRYRNDELQLTLNNQRFVHTIAGVHLQVGRWYNISASFDLQAKTVLVMLDGELVSIIKLDSEFTLNVIGSTSDLSDRHFTYTNYSNAGVFHGYVDNLIVFNRALSTDEMRDVYHELSSSLVPDLVGQSQSAAEAMLVAADLLVGVVTYQASESVSVGQVISQSPLAGTYIAAGSTVDLVVSSGPAPVSVPNVVNQTLSQAEAALAAAGLALGSVTSQYHATIASDRVISQSVPASSQVAQGTAVDLVISNGPAPVSVPNVVNQTLSQAEAALAAAGLALGSVTSQYHATIASGLVISQSVPASSQVAQGTAVDLVISNGPVPLPPRLVVSPNDGYAVLLDSGDATPHPVSQTYLLRNPGGTAFDYQISTTAPWLDLSQTRGRLEVGAETSVTVSANAQVNTLAQNQVHEAEVRFDNLSDGTGNTVRLASAFVLADSESGWSVSTTEGFDDNSSLAAVDIPSNTTAVLRFLVDIPVTQQVSIAAASSTGLSLGFQQRRRGMGPQDNVMASINDEAVRQWFGDSDWERDSVSLDSCPRFPCEVTFEFQERQDTPATSGAVYIDNLAITPDVQPIAAVLPGSRSAQVGYPVTAFATIINDGTAVGEDCALRPVTPVPCQFIYQTTNPATNQLVGIANVPRDIPAGAAQSFVFAFTPDAALDPTDVELRFDCSNGGPANVVTGLNTFLLSASEQPVPDVVALGATLRSNGIVDIPGVNGIGVFSVASVNVGAGGEINVAADTGGVELPLSLLLCQTDPISGACLQGPTSEVNTEIAANATPTFGIFVAGSGQVPFDPAAHRVFVRFRDQAGVVRGATSVAVRTQ